MPSGRKYDSGKLLYTYFESRRALHIAQHQVMPGDLIWVGRLNKTDILWIIDRHYSHLSFEFCEYIEDNNIILFYLLTHTTHFWQPLNVSSILCNSSILRKSKSRVWTTMENVSPRACPCRIIWGTEKNLYWKENLECLEILWNMPSQSKKSDQEAAKQKWKHTAYI